MDCTSREFVVGSELWRGRTLYDLYSEAHTPWEWHSELFQAAAELGMSCFSTPFDKSSVDFLETLNPPAYKIASFEIVDLPLIEYIASKGRPIILSTGMATLGEISEAVDVVKSANVPLALLKCTSAYPSPPESMNLATIPHLAKAFDVPVGLSDHTLGIAVPVAAVALGACIIEKHFTLSRSDPGPDSAFSLEPQEFKAMVDAVRATEQAVGDVHYGVTEHDASSRCFRRSLYAVKDIAEGESFTHDNVRSIRPGYGLPPKFLSIVIGRKATRQLTAGTPINFGVF
jgi:pseudaminic acid synthase